MRFGINPINSVFNFLVALHLLHQEDKLSCVLLINERSRRLSSHRTLVTGFGIVAMVIQPDYCAWCEDGLKPRGGGGGTIPYLLLGYCHP